MKFLRVFVSPWLRGPELCRRRAEIAGGDASRAPDIYLAGPSRSRHRRAPSPGDNDEKPL